MIRLDLNFSFEFPKDGWLFKCNSPCLRLEKYDINIEPLDSSQFPKTENINSYLNNDEYNYILFYVDTNVPKKLPCAR